MSRIMWSWWTRRCSPPWDVTAGLKKEGAIVINSSKTPAELRPS